MQVSKLTGDALATAYAALKSHELGGAVFAYPDGGKIVVSGSGLPYHPQHPHRSAEGWTLGDEKTPAHCREYLDNRGCMGQWYAYEPGLSPQPH